MTTMAQRLGVDSQAVASLPALRQTPLPSANVLFEQAFTAARTDPRGANLLLAAAILQQGRETPEGRLAGALPIVARLVARADPMMTLGPTGAELRDRTMPNGWRYTMQSYPRFRYAWREGLRDLLQVGRSARNQDAFGEVEPADPKLVAEYALADAVDNVTRLDPAEPEPVQVVIQEQFPPPRIGFAITVVGLGLSFYGLYSTFRSERRLEERERRLERLVSRRR